MRDAIVFGQPLIEVGIVRLQQIHHRVVPADQAPDEQFRLLTERLPQIVIEIREQPQVRRHRVEIPELQPLVGKIGCQRRSFRIGQHPAHLLVQCFRYGQFPRRRHAAQFIIRQTAPQEKRQPRGQCEVVEPVNRPGGQGGWILFDSEEKPWTHQNRAQGIFDAILKSPRLASLAIELHRPGQILRCHRTPVGPLQQGAQNHLRALRFFLRGRGLPEKDLFPAGRHAPRLGGIGAGDRYLIDCRGLPGMPVQVKCRIIRLAFGFDE